METRTILSESRLSYNRPSVRFYTFITSDTGWSRLTILTLAHIKYYGKRVHPKDMDQKLWTAIGSNAMKTARPWLMAC